MTLGRGGALLSRAGVGAHVVGGRTAVAGAWDARELAVGLVHLLVPPPVDRGGADVAHAGGADEHAQDPQHPHKQVGDGVGEERYLWAEEEGRHRPGEERGMLASSFGV